MRSLLSLLLLTAAVQLSFTGCDHRQPLGADLVDGLPILVLKANMETVSSDFLADTFITIRAVVADANHGALEGQRVNFRAKTGFVVKSATTDSIGAALTYYHQSVKAASEVADTVTALYAYNDGRDTLIASLSIRILPTKANAESLVVGSVQLASSRSSVQIRGAGGVEQALISARVTDVFNNPVRDGIPVTFLITGGPGGGESLKQSTASTINGVAIVTFSSGTKLGVVEIQASCLGQSVRSPVLSITSGPPQKIDIRAISDTVTRDGSRWKMDVHAVLTDIFNNPVRDSISVIFMLNPRGSDSTMISIVNSALTGVKECAECVAVPGSAISHITYRSEMISDTVEVVAQTLVDDKVIRVARLIALPLPAEGLSLKGYYRGGPIRVPNSWTKDTALITGVLTDGFGYPVPGIPISIQSDAGEVLRNCIERNEQGVITGSGMCGDSSSSGDILNGYAITDFAGTVNFLIVISRTDKVETKDFREVVVTLTEEKNGVTTSKEPIKLTIQFTAL